MTSCRDDHKPFGVEPNVVPGELALATSPDLLYGSIYASGFNVDLGGYASIIHAALHRFNASTFDSVNCRGLIFAMSPGTRNRGDIRALLLHFEHIKIQNVVAGPAWGLMGIPGKNILTLYSSCSTGSAAGHYRCRSKLAMTIRHGPDPSSTSTSGRVSPLLGLADGYDRVRKDYWKVKHYSATMPLLPVSFDVIKFPQPA